MVTPPSVSRDVLVAIVNNVRDFTIARESRGIESREAASRNGLSIPGHLAGWHSTRRKFLDVNRMG